MNDSLIVTIVHKGWGSTVLEAAVASGARGGTVIPGRGAGINEKEKIFGMSIEPEKEIVLTLVPTERCDVVPRGRRAAGAAAARLQSSAYSVVLPSKCSSCASACALVTCTVPSLCSGGA